MKTTRLLTLLALSISLSACATKREVPFRAGPGEPYTGKLARYDYSTYAPIPDTPTSAVYRSVLTTIPYTRDNAFYGNHYGSGNRGGKPIDEMDEIFRRHDIAYAEATSLRMLQLADAACVEALHRMDKSRLSPEALPYYERAIKFFSNPNLALVGKPVSCYWRIREKPDCPFQTEGDMRQLFKLPPQETEAITATAAGNPPTALASTAKAKTPVKRLLARTKAKLKTRTPAAPPAVFSNPLLARQP